MRGIRSLIREWLLRRDIILSRPPGQFSITGIKLARAKQRGLEVKFAIDGGAANGGFTRELKKVYPSATVLSVEPRKDVSGELEQIARELPGVRIADALLSDTSGETVEFHEHGDQSSLLSMGGGQAFGEARQVPVIRLDDLLRREGMGWPDLIKLDLQGAELMALRGAPEALSRAQACLLEASFVPIMEGPLIAEVFRFMDERGFRCYDVLGLWHRPLDGALAQGDFLFVRNDSKLVADSRWNGQGTVA